MWFSVTLRNYYDELFDSAIKGMYLFNIIFQIYTSL